MTLIFMARLYVRKVVAITSLCIAIFLCFRFPQGRHKGQAIKGQWRQTTNRKCGQARPSSRCGRCYTVGEGRRRLSKLNRMSETTNKTMTSPHVLKQAGTPELWGLLFVQFGRGKFWRKFYDHVCVGYKYLRLTYYRLETTLLLQTTTECMAWPRECFIATHFSPTLSASPCLLLGVMCTSCNHFICLLKVNENILFSSDTCFDRDIFLPLRLGIRINEG